MDNTPLSANKPSIGQSWLKKRLFPMLILVMVIAIIVGAFYLYRSGKMQDLEGWGYLGVFVISLTLNATVILPVGNAPVMAVMAAALPSICILGLPIAAPFAVGIVGGFAAAIGESTGYAAGYSGQAMVEKKKKWYERIERWLKRWGWFIIFVFAAIPLLFDVVGLVSGALRFPFWRFFIASWLGRTLFYTLVAWGGVLGWHTLLNLAG